jgi:cell division protein FtsQ
MLSHGVNMKRVFFFLLVAVPTAIVFPALHHWIFEGDALFVESIFVVETEHVKPGEVREYLKGYIGKPFYGVDLVEMGLVVEQHPWVKRVVLRRAPPHEIIVEPIERKAIAVTGTGQKLLIDEDGAPFTRASNSDVEKLPLVKSKNKVRYKSAAEAILDYQTSSQVAGRIVRIEIDDDDGLHAYFENALSVELGSAQFAEKWKKLDAIWNELRKDGLTPDYIYLGNYPNPQQVAVKLRMHNDSRGYTNGSVETR